VTLPLPVSSLLASRFRRLRERTQAQATLRNTPIRAAAALEVQKQMPKPAPMFSGTARSPRCPGGPSRDSGEFKLLGDQSNGWYRDHAFCRTWEVVAAGAPLLTLVNLDELTCVASSRKDRSAWSKSVSRGRFI